MRQCSEGDNCSFRHDINKRAKSDTADFSGNRMREMPKSQRQESQVEECLDGPARITSKELAPLHSVKNSILQNACSTSPKRDADLG